MRSPPYPGASRAQDSARPRGFLRIKCGRNVKVGAAANGKWEGFHISFAGIAGTAIPSGIYDLQKIAREPLASVNGIGAILLKLAVHRSRGTRLIPVRRTCPPSPGTST